jgi:maleate cis-trans isomerase
MIALFEIPDTRKRIAGCVLCRPAVTSNQASAWMGLRLAGVDRPISGYGRLSTLPLPN